MDPGNHHHRQGGPVEQGYGVGHDDSGWVVHSSLS